MFHLGFYLKEFFKTCLKNPVSGLGFVFCTFALCVLTLNRSYIQDELSQRFVLQESGGHFHALVSADQNHSRLARQLRSLPGINRVEELSQDVISEQLEAIFGGFDLGETQELLAQMRLSFSGLKVIFDHDMESRSVDLVRDYMRRLVGSSNLTLGPFVQNQNEDGNSLQQFQVFAKWGSWITIGLTTFVWVIFAFFFASHLRKVGYLIEQFQRKKYVALKSYLCGAVALIAIFAVSLTLMGGDDYIIFSVFLILALMSSMILLRRYQWE